MENKSHAIFRQKRDQINTSAEARKQALLQAIYRGQMYQDLLNSGAWKDLENKYLEEHLNPQSLMNYLYSEEGDMKTEMIKMQALWELMAFIQSQVVGGKKAVEELKKLGVRDSEIG